MDPEEWEDLMEAHGWYNGATQDNATGKAAVDKTADR